MRFYSTVIFSIILFSIALTPHLTQNVFAAEPAFSLFVADDPNDLDAVLTDGDTLTITFSEATNATNSGTISQSELVANFTDNNIGADAAIDWGTTFSGVWNADSTILTVTLTDVTGATLSIGSSTIEGRSSTNISSAAEGTNTELLDATTVDRTLTGDFGLFVAASETSNGGGGCDDCTPPTLGVDKNNFRFVEDGLRYNRYSVDVEYFYTPFDLTLTKVGSENIAELKIYENSGAQSIQHIGLSFGLGHGEKFSDALATIEWDKVYGDEPKITVIDPENILENVRIVADPNLVKCKDDSSANECMIFRIYHTFRESPEFNMFSTYIWDENRNGWQNYYNHGINVVGESLNPPDQHTVFDRQGYLYTITETDTTHAIDGNGDKWYLDDDSFWKKKSFVKKSISNETPLAGYDRNHPYFTAYQNGQVLLGERTIKAILGVDSIQAILPDYISYTYDAESNDIELTNKMKLEEIRAFERMYKEYFELHPYGKQFPHSEPEIPEGMGGTIVTSNDVSQELLGVIGLMVGIIAVSIGVGFYSTRKK